MLGKNKEKKQKMSEGEALELLDDWGEALEVKLTDKEFDSVKDELVKIVQRERLSFDSEKDEFTYKLRKPLKKDDGSIAHEIIKIIDCEMAAKRDINRSKNNIDKGIETFKVYTRMSGEDETIPVGYLGQIKGHDEGVITAVILGFFVQAIPGE